MVDNPVTIISCWNDPIPSLTEHVIALKDSQSFGGMRPGRLMIEQRRVGDLAGGGSQKVNLANKITLARIFLVPVLMIFLLVKYDLGQFRLGAGSITVSEIIATLIFIIAAITDGLDGYIARKRKLVTNLGKFLDPLADKMLISAALISLVEMQRLDAWIAVVIISREFAVTGLRLVAAVEGQVIDASPLGKLKTIIQIIAVAALILNNFPFSSVAFPFSEILIWLAVIITVVSGVDYFVKNKRVIRFSKPR